MVQAKRHQPLQGRVSLCGRPRLERLEDRIQLGDTLLGVSAVALWRLSFTSLATPLMLDPGEHSYRWPDDLLASSYPVGSQLLADTGTDQAGSGTVGDRAGIGVTAEVADELAAPILARTDTLAEHVPVYRLAGLDWLQFEVTNEASFTAWSTDGWPVSRT
jgi:hypothetical protein